MKLQKMIKPTRLKKGDTIGVVSPSAPLAGIVSHRTKKGLEALKAMGFKIKIGQNALKTYGHTSGAPEERAADINSFFKNKDIKGIFSFIGGNHSNQILKYLDFNLIRKNPKIFLGYSDITVLHFALYTQANLTTFYGPAVLTQFAENPRMLPYTKQHLEKAIACSQPIGKINSATKWTDEVLDWFKKEDIKRPRKLKENSGWQWPKKGRAKGLIIGGCLPSIMHLRGTKYWPDFSKKILFWEIPENSDDFRKGEKPENIDSYLTDLELSGLFRKISGMIIGRPFGYTPRQINQLLKIVKERTNDYRFPILFNVDIGHTDPMITVPLGVQVKIDSRRNVFEFIEKATI